MSRDEEAKQFFRAASDEQLNDWLAGADPKTHPQYPRALDERRRREMAREDKKYLDAQKSSKWMIFWTALGVILVCVFGVIQCRANKQLSTPTPDAGDIRPIASPLPQKERSATTPTPTRVST